MDRLYVTREDLEAAGMPSPLEVIRDQAAERIAREMDRRLIWDWACAVYDGADPADLKTGVFPDRAKAICRERGPGEPVELLGPIHTVEISTTETHITWTVR